MTLKSMSSNPLVGLGVYSEPGGSGTKVAVSIRETMCHYTCKWHSTFLQLNIPSFEKRRNVLFAHFHRPELPLCEGGQYGAEVHRLPTGEVPVFPDLGLGYL